MAELLVAIAAADVLGDRDALTQELEVARLNAVALERDEEKARREAAAVEAEQAAAHGVAGS